MSGRGLGHTGGTLDKLEAIPGWRSQLSPAEVRAQLESVGCVICAAGAGLAPADGKLYALRDVTATVESIPLIASSIMSKKIAEGTSALVLDVKVGSGAFMADRARAAELARAMVDIGGRANMKVAALLTAMDVPLGRAVGNALEVTEAVEVLEGGGPPTWSRSPWPWPRSCSSWPAWTATPAGPWATARLWPCGGQWCRARAATPTLPCPWPP